MSHKIIKIISGGQTGVDRAALDVGLELGIPIGGWCPRGRRSEDGHVPDKYPLTEHESKSYVPRTRMNILDADGTLIVATRETFDGGTGLTGQLCQTLNRTRYVVLIGPEYSQEHLLCVPAWIVAANQVAGWIRGHSVSVLNVAGPRASKWPGGYEAATRLLRMSLAITNSSGALECPSSSPSASTPDGFTPETTGSS